MAFNGSFSIAVNSNPASIILTDTSSGSDGNLTSRTILLYKSDGMLYTPAITWPLAQNSITLPILTSDAALNIVVNWNASSQLPSPSTYSFSMIYAFTGYGSAFLYYLTQLISARPSVLQDKQYYDNKMRLFVEISSAQNAINVGQDVAGAQGCIDRYSYYITNQSYYF